MNLIHWLVVGFSLLLLFLIIKIIKGGKTYDGEQERDKTEQGITSGAEQGAKKKPNYGKYIKILFYLVVLAVILYFFLPYLMNMGKTEKVDGPLGRDIYWESQDGAGLVVNNGSNAIQLATGDSKTGTTFLLKTITNETGWPEFGADAYNLRGNATLKVSFIDLDNSSKSVHFSKVLIPENYSFRYSNKYKLSNYRAWVSRGNKKEEVDNKFTSYRKDAMRHNIEIRVYVPPNSYVELSNMAIKRDW